MVPIPENNIYCGYREQNHVGVHMTTGRKHDIRIAPILVNKVLRDFLLNLLLGDKGYDNMKFRKWVGCREIFPVIK